MKYTEICQLVNNYDKHDWSNFLRQTQNATDISFLTYTTSLIADIKSIYFCTDDNDLHLRE